MKPVPACLIALLLCLGNPACVSAEDTWPLFDGCGWNFPRLSDQWRARRYGCPDDYCAKPLPSVACSPIGCRDDYCPKPMVCPPSSSCGCIDDYCRKPYPLWITPWSPPACRCPCADSGRTR